MLRKDASAYELMMDSLKRLKSNAAHVHAPEDKFIKIICENHGYGAVISSAARQWFLKDPIGCIVPGWCAGTIEALKKTDKTIKIVKAARKFAKAWAKWSVTESTMPDEETIEAASALMEILGVKQPEVE